MKGVAMSQSSFDQNNPYQAPLPDAMTAPATTDANLRLFKMLKDFRAQILALGAFWIFIGVVNLGIGVAAPSFVGDRNDDVVPIVAVILGCVGLAWIVLGGLVCAKQMWAVYVALVLSYLTLLALLVVVILQAHRVLGWAKELTRLGIPLNMKPENLRVPISLPG
jgi:hypothetical protein